MRIVLKSCVLGRGGQDRRKFNKEMTLRLTEFGRISRILQDGEGWKAALGSKT